MPCCSCRNLCEYSDERCSKLTLLFYPFLLIVVLLTFYVKFLWIPLVIISAIFICWACADSKSNTHVRGNVTRRNANSMAVQSEITIPVAVMANPSDSNVGVHHIPCFAFERKTGTSSELVCSVCLEVLLDREMVRQLPACRHLFHVGCIDMWLGSHSTCPLCRSSVEVAKTATATEMNQSSSLGGLELTELPV